jgi:hypothetical protein
LYGNFLSKFWSTFLLANNAWVDLIAEQELLDPSHGDHELYELADEHGEHTNRLNYQVENRYYCVR